MEGNALDAAIEGINKSIAAAPEGQMFDLEMIHSVIVQNEILLNPADAHPTIEEFGNLLVNYLSQGLNSGQVIPSEILPALIDICRAITMIFPYDRYPDVWFRAIEMEIGILLRCDEVSENEHFSTINMVGTRLQSEVVEGLSVDLRQTAHFSLAVCFDDLNEAFDHVFLPHVIFHLEHALNVEGALQRGPQVTAAHSRLAEILLLAGPEDHEQVARILKHAKTACELSEAAKDRELSGPAYFILASAHEMLAQVQPESDLRPTISAALEAVAHFEEGSFHWAKGQLILGSALVTLAATPFPWKTRDDDTAGVDAISALRGALTVLTKSDEPDEWAFANFRLGWLYAETPDERGVNRYDEAIICYERALEVLQSHDLRNLKALTMYKLASSIALSATADPTNLERAHSLLDTAQASFEADGNALLIASAKYMRGNVLGQKSIEIVGSERVRLCNEALQEYDAALQVLTAELMPPVHAEILILSVTVLRYAEMASPAARSKVQFERLEQATQILEAFPPSPQLAKAYLLRAECRRLNHPDELEQIDKAISDSQHAVSIATQIEIAPLIQTASETNGQALLAKGLLGGGNEKALLSAEGIFSKCVQYHENKTDSIEWIENSLSLLRATDRLSELGRPRFLSEVVEVLENLISSKAIRRAEVLADIHFRLGMHYFLGRKANVDTSLAEAEKHCRTAAQTYAQLLDKDSEFNALGNLALVLATTNVGDQQSHRQEALKICRDLLSGIDKGADPSQYAQVSNHVAVIISMQIAHGEIHEKALLFGLFHAYEASEIWKEQGDNLRWARMQINIGAMLAAAPRSHQTSQFNMARENIDEALKILNRDEHPEEWRFGHYNLGLVFSMNGSSSDKESYLKAVELFDLVEDEIETLHPFMFPRLCKFKGRCFLELERYDEALEQFEISATACANLCAQAIYPETKRLLVHANQGLAANALEAGAGSNELARSIFIADRSRGVQQRLLLDRDRRQWRRLSGKQRGELEKLLNEIAQLEDDAKRPLELRERGFLDIQHDLTKNHSEFSRIAKEYGLHAPAATWTDEGLLPMVPANGALVYLVPGKSQGEALVIQREDDTRLSYTRCPLPAASAEDIRAWVQEWLGAYGAFRNCIADGDEGLNFDQTHQRAECEMFLLLEKLWLRVMKPLSDALTSLVDGGFPHGHAVRSVLKIVPFGDFQLLPLHAAGHDDETGSWFGVDDLFAVSYWVGSLTQLNQADAKKSKNADEIEMPEPFVLGLLNPTGGDGVYDDLQEAAEKEQRVLEDSFSTPSTEFLPGKLATFENLKYALIEKKLLPTHLHFSCHAQFELNNPSQSGLTMANDELLSIADISELPLHGCDLVMLAACETAMVDVLDLPDELVSLPAAFAQAGANNVIGAQWLVPDDETVALLERFYRLHRQQNVSSVHALRDCRISLRNGELSLEDNGGPEIANISGQEIVIESGDAQSPLVWPAFAHFTR